MKKRSRLIWLLATLVLAGGAYLWIKSIVDEQPTEHADPGIPDVVVPDPPDEEE